MTRSTRLLALIALGSPFLCAMIRVQGSGEPKPRGLAAAGKGVLESHVSRFREREAPAEAGLGRHPSGRPVLPRFQPPPPAAAEPQSRAVSRRPALDGSPLAPVPPLSFKLKARNRQAETGLQVLAPKAESKASAAKPAADDLEDSQSTPVSAIRPGQRPGPGLGRPRPSRDGASVLSSHFLGFSLHPGPAVNLGELPPGAGVPQVRKELEPSRKGEPATLIIQNPSSGKSLTLALAEAARGRGMQSRVEPLVPLPGGGDGSRDLREPFPLEPGQTCILTPGFVDSTETFVLRDELDGEFARLVLSLKG